MIWPFRPQRRYCIAVDIGSHTTIRSLLFETEGGECVALGKRHVELPPRARDQGFISAAVEHLRRLLARHTSDIGRLPDATLIGLGSHFTFSQVTKTSRIRPRPREPVSRGELQSLLRDFLQANREPRASGGGYHLAHLVPLHVEVDGYPMEILTPRTRGQSTAITLLATYASYPYWAALSAFRGMFGGFNIGFIANQAAVASVLQARLGIQDALVIKVGAHITDIAVLARGAVLSAGQLAVGGDDVTAAIAARLGSSRADAERIKRRWEQVAFPSRLRRPAGKAIAAAVGQWLSALTAFLRSDERVSVPERVFLLGGGSRLEALAEVMKRGSWHRGLSSARSIAVARLSAEDVAGALFRNPSPVLAGPEETALAAVTWRMAA